MSMNFVVLMCRKMNHLKAKIRRMYQLRKPRFRQIIHVRLFRDPPLILLGSR
jgi:hypothetical protein